MEVKFVNATPDGEKLMGYCARVSNPANQDNPDYAKLLRFCLKKGHWSVFEHAFMTLEVTTSRAIAPQILRHRSFTFQEFSQRYAVVSEREVYKPRSQDLKNRQSSNDDLSEVDKNWFEWAQAEIWEYSQELYQEALKRGIAKECARFLLPGTAKTTIYMTGPVRSWIHYIQLRTTPGTQKEHRDIALEAKRIFGETFPTVAEAMKEEEAT